VSGTNCHLLSQAAHAVARQASPHCGGWRRPGSIAVAGDHADKSRAVVRQRM